MPDGKTLMELFIHDQGVGAIRERQRITDIILKLTDHKEHSEACLKMHWLAEHAIATMWEEEE